MNCQEIFAAACKLAPLSLSDAFVRATNGYDNSGLILPPKGDTDKVLVTLDLTPRCAEYAAENGFGLIITHHPAIYAPVRTFGGRERGILICARNGIGVISMHLNLDIAEEGIDHCLAEGLGASEQKILTPIAGGLGYGRLFSVETTDLEGLKRRICRVFETDNVMLFGDRSRPIRKIASFCGAGCSDAELDMCDEADAVVSADMKHHVIREALNRGKCVVQMTHYASENYGMKHFFARLLAEIKGGAYAEYFDDREF